MRRKYGKTVFTLFLLLMCIMCLPSSVSAAVKLNCNSKKLYIGQTYKLKASGTKKKVKWSSSNPKVARVNSSGRVMAKKTGTVTITAKANGKTAKCKVTVKAKEWYAKVIRARNAVYNVPDVNGGSSRVYLSNFSHYCVRDIDKDGSKELILMNDRGSCLLLGYYKGKVIPFLYSGSLLRHFGYKGKNVIVSVGSSMASTYYVYEIKNHKMKEIINIFHTTSSIVAVPFYKVNGIKCTQSVFNANYQKYIAGFKEFSENRKPI